MRRTASIAGILDRRLIDFQIRYLSLPLTEPYRLSFGTIDAFDTFIVRAMSDAGVGYGEITPLPGYSEESRDSVESAIKGFAVAADSGSGYDTILTAIYKESPMAASGLRMAVEVSELGFERVFSSQEGVPISVAALCSGKDADEAAVYARKLVQTGARTIKLKVGSAPVEADIERLRAVADTVADKAVLRIDANQRLDPERAEYFVTELEGMPIELLEQPFPPVESGATRNLSRLSPVPIMLDESIWESSDLDDAVNQQAKYVKFKLCKHGGLKGCQRLIEKARKSGLKVVFGNGVQSPVGNRAEVFVYRLMGLDTAIESNGFSKICDSPGSAGLSLRQWTVHENGLTDAEAFFNAGKPIADCVYAR